MKNKTVFVASLIVVIAAVVSLGVNRFVFPLPDIAVRIIGGITLVDIFVLSFSSVKLAKKAG